LDGTTRPSWGVAPQNQFDVADVPNLSDPSVGTDTVTYLGAKGKVYSIGSDGKGQVTTLAEATQVSTFAISQDGSVASTNKLSLFIKDSPTTFAVVKSGQTNVVKTIFQEDRQTLLTFSSLASEPGIIRFTDGGLIKNAPAKWAIPSTHRLIDAVVFPDGVLYLLQDTTVATNYRLQSVPTVSADFE